MNDNDIIKALECCLFAYGKKCEECPYEKHKPFLSSTQFCTYSLKKDILDLINRQKAEIERLESINNAMRSDIEKAIDEMKELPILYEKDIATAKAEAVKEFAERLKANISVNAEKRLYIRICLIAK